MKVSTLLDHIDSGHIALPEFQRGYVWNRNQGFRIFTDVDLFKAHIERYVLAFARLNNSA